MSTAEPQGSAPPRPSRTEQVVDQITAMILDGRLGAGQRLPVEKDLATTLGVSRSSLREGVRALSVLGVLETRQGDGTYVTALDPGLLVGPLGLIVELQSAGHTRHVHAVRRMLETEAAGLAAAGAHPPGAELAAAGRALDAASAAVTDPDGADRASLISLDLTFHQSLAAAAGNPVLAALIEALGGRTARERVWRGVVDPEADARSLREHQEILRAVVDGDVDRARVRMAAHLLAVEDFLETQG